MGRTTHRRRSRVRSSILPFRLPGIEFYQATGTRTGLFGAEVTA